MAALEPRAGHDWCSKHGEVVRKFKVMTVNRHGQEEGKQGLPGGSRKETANSNKRRRLPSASSPHKGKGKYEKNAVVDLTGNNCEEKRQKNALVKGILRHLLLGEEET